MPISAADRDFIDAVATEMRAGIHAALNGWMSKIDNALEDTRLTTLGRLRAVREIVSEYQTLAADMSGGRQEGDPHSS